MIKLVQLIQEHLDTAFTMINIQGYLLDTDTGEVYRMNFDIQIKGRESANYGGYCLHTMSGQDFPFDLEFLIVDVEGKYPHLYITCDKTNIEIDLFTQVHRTGSHQFRSE